MKAIFLMLFAILRYNVECAKIRATRTRWIQYTPLKQVVQSVPVATQFYTSNQYYSPNNPIHKNSRLIYSYVDPYGSRFNMHGYGGNGLANLEANKSYLTSQKANEGQINQIGYQTGSGFDGNDISFDQGGVKGYEIVNSAHTVYKTQPRFTVSDISVEHSGLNGNGDQIQQTGDQIGGGLATNGITFGHGDIKGYGIVNTAHSVYHTQPSFAVNGISVEHSGLNGNENLNGEQTEDSFAANGITFAQGDVNGYGIENTAHSVYHTQPSFAVNGISVEHSGLNGNENLNGEQTEDSFAANGITFGQGDVNGYGIENTAHSVYQTQPSFAVSGISVGHSSLNENENLNGEQTKDSFAANGISFGQGDVNGYGIENTAHSVYQTQPSFAVSGISVGHSGLNGNQNLNGNQIGEQTEDSFAANGITFGQGDAKGYLIENTAHSVYQTQPSFALSGISVGHSDLNGNENVNGDQIQQIGGQVDQHQNASGFNVNGISDGQSGLNGYEELISESHNQNWNNYPMVHSSWSNYGHDHDLAIDGEDKNYVNSGQNVYPFDQNVPNADQINFPVDHNIQSGANKNQVGLFVNKSNAKAEPNYFGSGVIINGEGSPSYSVSDNDLSLSNIANLYSADPSKVSYRSNENETNNGENASTLNAMSENDLAFESNGFVINAEQNKQEELKEVPNTDVNALPENHLTTSEKESILTKNKVGSKLIKATNTENFISEYNLIAGDEEGTDSVDVNREELPENDAHLQIFKGLFESKGNTIPPKHMRANNFIIPTANRYLNPVDQYHLQNVENTYKINAIPNVYPYIWQRNQVNRYRVPQDDVNPIHEQTQNVNPVINAVPENISSKIVQSLVSSVCLNPQINVIPGSEQLPAQKRLDSLLRILQIFGIRNTPPNIYKNIALSQNIDTRDNLSRRPFDYDYADGAYEPIYDHDYNSLSGLSNVPVQHYSNVQMPIEPSMLPESLSTETPPKGIVDDMSVNLKNHIDENGYKAVGQETFFLQPKNYDEENIVMAAYTNPKPQNQSAKETMAEEFISLMMHALTPHLVRFYSQCHSEINEKLVEGIETLIDTLQHEHCEVKSQW